MANGYFERGEIYWVRMDNGFGYEQGVGRPGVVLSCNQQNISSGVVTVAFCSKQQHGTWEVETNATGCTSYIKCSQINTIDKSRLGKCIGVLNSAEMRELESVLEDYFDFGYVDDQITKEKDREIEARDAVIAEKDAEIAALKARVAEEAAKVENAEMSYRVEIAMWQKLYEKALNQVVDMKFAHDLKNPTPAAPEKLPIDPAVLPKHPATDVVEDDKVDINHCTITELKKLGLSLPLARLIVSRRPYEAVIDLKTVPGMKATQYRILEPKLCCKPVVKSALVEEDPGYEVTETEAAPVKVNINTASAKELNEVLGLTMTTCYSISGYRKKNGPYKKVDDLLNVHNIFPGTLEKFRDKLEV